MLKYGNNLRKLDTPIPVQVRPQDNLYIQSLPHKGKTSGPRPAALSLAQHGDSEHRLCLDKIPPTANQACNVERTSTPVCLFPIHKMQLSPSTSSICDATPTSWQAGFPSHLPEHQQEVHAERTEDNMQAALPTAPLQCSGQHPLRLRKLTRQGVELEAGQGED